MFKINSTTGEIRTSALLDYEMKQSHVIVVNAKDPVTNITGVAFVYVNVTDVNEYSLVFSTALASASVSELATVGAYVAQVKATDADGNTQITQSISSGNDGTFVIDATTGVIRLNSNISHSVTPSYMLTVQATDAVSGISAYHNITIRIKNENNNNLVFGQTSYISNTPLNSTVGTIVTTVIATDPDNLGPLSFTVGGTISNEYFSVNSSSGVVTIKKSLAGAGLASPYVLMVCATDSGTPSTTNCVPIIITTGNYSAAFFCG